ncbi:hypothetical protein EX895_001548 [Sporisorium graminicola]|uniref:Uncharacterized protein n=1 Tax=Sporisorium graminicola TaxID=280036 RepID=A0A4U7KYF1_9BASI|nr:hypothetical protein EX895_001548 [Sporisorium graminicola]TKY89763.1 hypothetical protein EX895_001548 [Sporisorium graminicola]
MVVSHAPTNKIRVTDVQARPYEIVGCKIVNLAKGLRAKPSAVERKDAANYIIADNDNLMVPSKCIIGGHERAVRAASEYSQSSIVRKDAASVVGNGAQDRACRDLQSHENVAAHALIGR